MTKWQVKAERFLESEFFIAGNGCFDLNVEEIAMILRLVENDDFETLNNYYETLREKYMDMTPF